MTDGWPGWGLAASEGQTWPDWLAGPFKTAPNLVIKKQKTRALWYNSADIKKTGRWE